MAKGKKAQHEGEQLDLIDVKPENAKEILRSARSYKKFQAVRTACLSNQVQEKQILLKLVKDAKLQASPDGSMKFKLDGITVCIKPRDELVSVKCDEEEE